MKWIAVLPGVERVRRQRLFDALETAFAVRFAAEHTPETLQADAVLAFGEAAGSRSEGSSPLSLCFTGEETATAPCRTLAFTEHPALARPLHAARLTEEHALCPVSSPPYPSAVLATAAGSPVWLLAERLGVRRHLVGAAPAELAPGEALRNRLAPGRCLALLALASFVREVLGEEAWQLPGPRAAFVLDDPNLRRPAYGHVDYAALRASAETHGYHVSVAMIPLDARRGPAHPRAVTQFGGVLSLCVHGNDHRGPELSQPRTRAEGLPAAAQALRRVAAFERVTGLTVDRVMVPPHDALSQGMSAALAACGYEAFSAARPYPWIAHSPDLRWLTRPAGAGPLVGWGSAELTPGQLPHLMRMDAGHPREEIVLRAFLGQPVIVYGHHDLLADGPAELEEIAAAINRLGDVRWSSLAGIARGAIEQRRRGSRLEVRVLGRRVEVEIAPGVLEVSVSAHALSPAPHAPLRVTGPQGATRLLTGPEGRLEPAGSGRLEIALLGALDPGAVPAPAPAAGPLLRRVVTEWRDRCAPALAGWRR